MTQHVFITAGGSGLGLAMAKAFLDNGAKVAVTDADPAMLERARADAPGLVGFTADASNEDEMADVFSQLRSRWTDLDVVMANAGTAGPTAAIEDVTLTEWKSCLAVNLDGSFLTARLAAPWMKDQQRGVMTLTSSTAGLFGYPFRSPYAAAKWGIIGLMKTLAMELGPFGIRVNAICPGAVEGDRMDRVIAKEAEARGISEADLRQGYGDCVSLRRFVTAEDIANTALFLASPMAKNVSGMAMTVDGHTEKVTL
ncbi:MAG: SDR family oxidoreductase [Alphaproteobacteria bacterium]|nr:SDR family oxidoreductase [Alphaproteobacteria bacterium]